MANLYRKSASDRFISLEQLNKAVVITSPMSWLALIGISIIIAAAVWGLIFGKLPSTVSSKGIILNPENTGIIFATETGTLTEYNVNIGSTINVGDVIATVRSSSGEMKTITSGCAGKISMLLCDLNENIISGSEIARITPDVGSQNVAVIFVPVVQAQNLVSGMRAVVYSESNSEAVNAEVIITNRCASSVNNMTFILGKDNKMNELFLEDGPVCTVVCRLSDGGTIPVNSIIDCKIVIDESSPIGKLL